MSEIAWRLVAGVLILAILFVLVRPGSSATKAITDITGALTALVKSAVG
jgi:hypothetical protein